MPTRTKKADTSAKMPKDTGFASTRAVLIRCGMEMLTEQGFVATGLDAILKRAMVPKGSFYHYFESKVEFGREIMKAYDAYFVKKLDRWLLDDGRKPMDRITDFVADAKAGMARHRYTRGCLVGNLSQELGALPTMYRIELNQILLGWQERMRLCLEEARLMGSISRKANTAALAEFFWIGWEGAVMRARLTKNADPIDTFIEGFMAGLPRN